LPAFLPAVALICASLIFVPELASGSVISKNERAGASQTSTMLVTGLATVVELPVSFHRVFLDWYSNAGDVCVQFWVRNISAAPAEIKITSTGISGARLIEAQACPGSGAATRTTIPLSKVDNNERSVFLVVPSGAFPENISGTKGKILVLEKNIEPLEVPISLRRADYSPMSRALIWFWSMFCSALVAALFSLWIYKLNKHIDAKSNKRGELDEFRRDEDGTLKKFLSLYPNLALCTDAAQYRREMEDALTASRILLVLPSKERENLLQAVRRFDRKRVNAVLAKTFPGNEHIFRAGT
jgi:hypothetical protein